MTSFASNLQPAIAQPMPAPELEPEEPVVLIDEAELDRLRLEAQKFGESAGHEQGYALGLAQGHAAGLAAVQAQAAQLQTLAQALPAAMQQAQTSIANDLLALALDIARQVLGQTLAAEPQAILAVVQELLHAEPGLLGAPQLLLHPDDAALVKEFLADDLKAAGWRIRTDAHIARGGCRVTAHSGERDATVPARWERVSAALARSPAAETQAMPETAGPA